MAQTKRKRRTKHRGNAAGMVEARGRTGRTVAAPPKDRKGLRAERLNRPPTWTSALNRAAIAAVLFVVIVVVIGQGIPTAVAIGGLMFLLYVPLGYYTDSFIYKRRNRGKA
jgi:hypothetical protein